MVPLLTHAREELIPYFTTGAFASFAPQEFNGDWSNIALDEGFLTISATKGKTASRRVVPISTNLKAWLMPFFQTSGRVVPFDNIQATGRARRRTGDEMEEECPASLVLLLPPGDLKDSGKVAYEAANSSTMIYRHYQRTRATSRCHALVQHRELLWIPECQS